MFCSKCSSKECSLPKLGIEREVRVCDSCYDIHAPKEDKQQPQQLSPSQDKKSENDLPAEYLASPLSRQSQEPQKNGNDTALAYSFIITINKLFLKVKLMLR